MIIKTYLSLFMFLLFFLSLLFGQEGQLNLWQTFPDGLNTKLSSHLIGDNEFQQCDNVYTDEDVGVMVRGGVTSLVSTQLKNSHFRLLEWIKPQSGPNLIYSVIGTSIGYTEVGVSAFSTNIGTLPANSAMWGESYNNKFYIGGYNTDRWEVNLDGYPAVVVSTNIPKMRYSTIYIDKLTGVNVNETLGGSKFVYSDVGNPNSFPALNYLYIDKDDGQELTGVFTYRGNLYVTKKNKIFILTGLDDGYSYNDGYFKIIDGIGCLFGETIQERMGLIYFVSLRGVEEFDGNSCKLVSLAIENTFKSVGQIKYYDNFTVANSTFPLVAIVEDDRYWVAVDTGTDFINDVIYVLDKKNDWVRFTGLPVSRFAIYKNQLIIGTGNAGKGYLQKYDDTYTGDWIDGSSGINLTAISPVIQTKNFSFGTYVNDKTFKECWVTVKPTTQFANTTIDYYINTSTATEGTITISLSANNSYPNIPITTQFLRNTDRWRYINFKISNFERVYGLNFTFDFLPKGNQ